jgi:hypothetical protein
MSETNGLEELSRPVLAAGVATQPPVRRRQGMRVALLSIASAILLLGAAIAAVFGYRIISGGAPAAAAYGSHHLGRPSIEADAQPG